MSVFDGIMNCRFQELEHELRSLMPGFRSRGWLGAPENKKTLIPRGRNLYQRSAKTSAEIETDAPADKGFRWTISQALDVAGKRGPACQSAIGLFAFSAMASGVGHIPFFFWLRDSSASKDQLTKKLFLAVMDFRTNKSQTNAGCSWRHEPLQMSPDCLVEGGWRSLRFRGCHCCPPDCFA